MKRILFIIICCFYFFACKKNTQTVKLYSEIHSTDRMRDNQFEIIRKFYNEGGRIVLLERGFCRAELFNHWADTGEEKSLEIGLTANIGEYKELRNDINFYKKYWRLVHIYVFMV